MDTPPPSGGRPGPLRVSLDDQQAGQTAQGIPVKVIRGVWPNRPAAPALIEIGQPPNLRCGRMKVRTRVPVRCSSSCEIGITRGQNRLGAILARPVVLRSVGNGARAIDRFGGQSTATVRRSCPLLRRYRGPFRRAVGLVRAHRTGPGVVAPKPGRCRNGQGQENSQCVHCPDHSVAQLILPTVWPGVQVQSAL